MEDRVKDGSVSVLVASCDRYSDLWPAFFHCWFKYWPDCPFKVYLGTNHRIFPDPRVHTLAIGDDVSYTDNLRKMLDRIGDEWVIFWIEDRMLSGPINTDRIIRLLGAAKAEGAGYMKLIPEHPLAYFAQDAEYGRVPPGTSYRVSMTVAMWNRRTLRELLETGETAWDTERLGARRSDSIARPFLALSPGLRRNPPISHVHTVVRGRLRREAIRFAKREGILSAFSAREMESFWSYAYGIMYTVAFRVLRPIQHVWLTRMTGT